MGSSRRKKLAGADKEPELARIWTPAVVERIAAHLPPNEVAGTLRFVEKCTAEQLSNRGGSVQLSQPVPRELFAARWQAPGACRSLSREQREQLICLTASAGDVANLEVALAAAGLASCKNERGEGTLFDALGAAARACQVDCCRLLAASLDLPLTDVARLILPAAAARGDMASCKWAWEVFPVLQCDTAALCIAAEAGHRAVCEAKPGGIQRKAAAQAALSAAKGGHTGLLDWLLSLCPGPWCDPDNWRGLCNPHRLVVAAAKGCDAATLQRQWAEHGEAGGLNSKAWGEVLRAAVSSRTPDWAAKAEWALRQGAEANARACYTKVASLPDAVARFTWLKDHGLPPDLSPDARAWLWYNGPGAPLREAVRAGNMEAVEWLLGEGLLPDPETVEDGAGLELAAGDKRDVAILEALLRAGCLRFLGDVAYEAASNGHIPVLEWVRDTLDDPSALRPLGGKLQYATAASGSVRTVAWLREQGCKPGGDAWEGAVMGGCEAVMDLLHEWRVGKPASRPLYLLAANWGDLCMLRALRRLGFTFGPRTRPEGLFTQAVEYSPLPALQWLVAQGCPVDWAEAVEEAECAREVGYSDRIDERVLPWIQEQRQQWIQSQIQPAPAQADGKRKGGGGRGKGRGSGRRGAKRAKGGRRRP